MGHQASLAKLKLPSRASTAADLNIAAAHCQHSVISLKFAGPKPLIPLKPLH